MTKIIWLVTSVLLLNGVATAQIASLDQSAAITKTALDYIEGWYAGDAHAWNARFIPNWPSE